jgi:hypothetical protein
MLVNPLLDDISCGGSGRLLSGRYGSFGAVWIDDCPCGYAETAL